MFRIKKKNLESELNKENMKLVNIGDEDYVEFPLSSENNTDPLTMQLFPGGLVFYQQQPLFVSGLIKYRFLKFLFNHPVEFLFFQLSSFVAEAPESPPTVQYMTPER